MRTTSRIALAASGALAAIAAATASTTVVPPPATTGRRPATPECRSRDLRLGLIGAGVATSHDFQILTFANASGRACFTAGFPGVSYVAGDNGVRVGAPAVREGGSGPRVALAPGAVASTVIDSISTGVWDPAKCRPTPVRGFRVYPPDERASLFVPLRGAQGCAGDPGGPQLTVVTLRAGIQRPTRY